MVDPRELFETMDSELMALWSAHFALKVEASDAPPAVAKQDPPPPRWLNAPDERGQIDACARLIGG